MVSRGCGGLYDLARYTAWLHPGQIEDMQDMSLVHTVGYACYVLGDADSAARAGTHFVFLMRDCGADLTGNDDLLISGRSTSPAAARSGRR
jgi:hypothetical protein